MCIFECWQTPKPLQNQEPTVSASYKRSPLQNQEPALSISLQALRLSKKMVLANPRGSWQWSGNFWRYQFPSAGQKGQKSSVQPSSNGSWFCPMRCLISTPTELFPRIHRTGCAAGINRLQSGEPRNAPQHQRSDARHRCLEPNHQFSSERIIQKQTVKRYKEAEFQILTSESRWDDSLWQRRVPSVYQL